MFADFFHSSVYWYIILHSSLYLFSLFLYLPLIKLFFYERKSVKEKDQHPLQASKTETLWWVVPSWTNRFSTDHDKTIIISPHLATLISLHHKHASGLTCLYPSSVLPLPLYLASWDDVQIVATTLWAQLHSGWKIFKAAEVSVWIIMFYFIRSMNLLFSFACFVMKM